MQPVQWLRDAYKEEKITMLKENIFCFYFQDISITIFKASNRPIQGLTNSNACKEARDDRWSPLSNGTTFLYAINTHGQQWLPASCLKPGHPLLNRKENAQPSQSLHHRLTPLLAKRRAHTTLHQILRAHTEKKTTLQQARAHWHLRAHNHTPPGCSSHRAGGSLWMSACQSS